MSSDFWLSWQQWWAQGVTASWVLAFADVTIVAFLIFRVLKIIQGTRAASMFWGLSVIVALYFISRYFGLVTLLWLLGNFLSSIILVIIVIFQDEIRRGLTKFGTHTIFTRSGNSNYTHKLVENLVTVCGHLSREKIGALVVLQRSVGLDDFVEDATILDALLSRKLLYSLFVKDSALHDGAVVIEGERIKAAGCVLPLSFDPDLDPALGTRHRAGIGLSERCDALILAVSEETGRVSFIHDGKINRNLDPSQLRDRLLDMLSGQAESLAAAPQSLEEAE